MSITGKSIFCKKIFPVRMCSNCLTVLIIICLETFDVALPNGYNKIKRDYQIRFVCPPSSGGIVDSIQHFIYVNKYIPYDAVVLLWVYFLCALLFIWRYSVGFLCSLLLFLFFLQPFPEFFGTDSRRYSLRFLMWFMIKICFLHFPSIERSSRPQIALSDTFVIRRMNIARRWARAIDNTMDS